DLPAYDFDMGACLRPLMGESDRIFRETLATTEAIGEGVIVINDIEKAFAGSQTSTGDSGVRRNLFGYFLKWIESFEASLLVIGTCNSFKDLATELLGRCDEIWGVGMPRDAE